MMFHGFSPVQSPISFGQNFQALMPKWLHGSTLGPSMWLEVAVADETYMLQCHERIIISQLG
jgi:hypothetical protein